MRKERRISQRLSRNRNENDAKNNAAAILMMVLDVKTKKEDCRSNSRKAK